MKKNVFLWGMAVLAAVLAGCASGPLSGAAEVSLNGTVWEGDGNSLSLHFDDSGKLTVELNDAGFYTPPDNKGECLFLYTKQKEMKTATLSGTILKLSGVSLKLESGELSDTLVNTVWRYEADEGIQLLYLLPPLKESPEMGTSFATTMIVTNTSYQVENGKITIQHGENTSSGTISGKTLTWNGNKYTSVKTFLGREINTKQK